MQNFTDLITRYLTVFFCSQLNNCCLIDRCGLFLLVVNQFSCGKKKNVGTTFSNLPLKWVCCCFSCFQFKSEEFTLMHNDTTLPWTLKSCFKSVMCVTKPNMKHSFRSDTGSWDIWLHLSVNELIITPLTIKPGASPTSHAELTYSSSTLSRWSMAASTVSGRPVTVTLSGSSEPGWGNRISTWTRSRVEPFRVKLNNNSPFETRLYSLLLSFFTQTAAVSCEWSNRYAGEDSQPFFDQTGKTYWTLPAKRRSS